jgi:hypothetical protein
MVIPWSYWPEGENADRATDPDPAKRSRITVAEYAGKLRTIAEADLGLDTDYEIMDVAGHGFNVDETHDYFDSYREQGIYFQPSKKNRDLSGYDLISEALKPRPTDDGMRPLLTIFREGGHNDKLIWQLKNLRYREWKGNVTDKDAPEEPEQKSRHLIDCLSYILLDGPTFLDRKGTTSDFKPIYKALGY